MLRHQRRLGTRAAPATSFLRAFSFTPSGHFAPSSIHFFKISVSALASRSSAPVTLFFGGISFFASSASTVVV